MAYDYLGSGGQRRGPYDYLSPSPQRESSLYDFLGVSDSASPAQPLLEDDPSGVGLLTPITEFGKGLWSSLTAGNIEMLGGAAEALEVQAGSDPEGSVGRRVQRWIGGKQTAQPMTLEELTAGGVLSDAWGVFSKLTGVTGSALGSMAAPMVAGAAGFAAAGPVGAVGGAFSTGAMLNIGETYLQLRDEGVDPKQAAQWAIPVGAGVGVIDTVGLNRVLGATVLKEIKGDAIRRVTIEAGKGYARGASEEGLTEMAQAAVRESVAGHLTGNPDLQRRAMSVLEEGFAGAAGGGFIGGVGRGVRTARGRPTVAEQTRSAAPARPDLLDGDGSDMDQLVEEGAEFASELPGVEAESTKLGELNLPPVGSEAVYRTADGEQQGRITGFIEADADGPASVVLTDGEGIETTIDLPLQPGESITATEQAQAARAVDDFVGEVAEVVQNEDEQQILSALRGEFGAETLKGIPADRHSEFVQKLKKRVDAWHKATEERQAEQDADLVFDEDVGDARGAFPEGEGFAAADKAVREKMGLAPDSTVPPARRPIYLQLVKKEAARVKKEAAEREKAAKAKAPAAKPKPKGRATVTLVAPPPVAPAAPAAPAPAAPTAEPDRTAGRPPQDRSTYASLDEYNARLRATYAEEGVSSRTTPQTAPVPEVGSWMIDGREGLDGREIVQVVELPVDNIAVSEDTGVQKWPDVERYAEWWRQGQEPPPINVVQTDKGTLKTLDHRRLLAAKLAGQTKVKALVSWSTSSDRSGNPAVGLTYELAQKGQTPLPVAEVAPENRIHPDDARRLDQSRSAISPSNERQEPEAPARLERFAPARERPAAAESYVPATQERGQVVMADGATHDVRYEVVDAADLIPSNTLRGEEVGGRDPRFLAELQPRDLSKVEEREKIRAIAQNPDPRRLGRSQTADSGAPLVGPDGIVESGNGRTLGILVGYQRGTAGDYRAMVDQIADTSGMQAPVLVRMREGDLSIEERKKLTRDANRSTAATMSTTDQAFADADLLGDTAFSQYQGGEFDSAQNASFLQRLVVDVIPPNERNQFTDAGGKVSAAGKNRIAAAFVARAYGSRSLVQDFMESAEPERRSVRNALVNQAAAWAKMREGVATVAPDQDITEALTDAVQLIGQSVTTKQPIQNLFMQQALIADADPLTAGARGERAKLVLRWFYHSDPFVKAEGAPTRLLGQPKMEANLRRWIEVVDRYDPNQGTMFGPVESPVERLERGDFAAVATTADDGGLFASPAQEEGTPDDQSTPPAAPTPPAPAPATPQSPAAAAKRKPGGMWERAQPTGDEKPWYVEGAGQDVDIEGLRSAAEGRDNGEITLAAHFGPQDTKQRQAIADALAGAELPAGMTLINASTATRGAEKNLFRTSDGAATFYAVRFRKPAAPAPTPETQRTGATLAGLSVERVKGKRGRTVVIPAALMDAAKRIMNADVGQFEHVSEPQADGGYRATEMSPKAATRLYALLNDEETQRGREHSAPADEAQRRAQNADQPAPTDFDPVQVAKEGETVLRSRLATLSVEQLRKLISKGGMSRGQQTLRWKPERLIDRIVEMSLSRATHGDAFRRDTAEPGDRMAQLRSAAARAEQGKKPVSPAGDPHKARRNKIRGKLDRVEERLETLREKLDTAEVGQIYEIEARIEGLETEQVELYEDLSGIPEPDAVPVMGLVEVRDPQTGGWRVISDDEFSALRKRVETAARRIAPKVKVQLEDEATVDHAALTGNWKAGLAPTGTYYQGVIQVAMRSTDPESTIRHEGLHALFDMGFITPDEWAALGRAVRRGGWIKVHRVDERYGDKRYHVEEAIAHEFAYWQARQDVTTPLAGDSVVNRVFKRIARLLDSLRDTLMGGRKAVQIFRAIESGEVGARTPGLRRARRARPRAPTPVPAGPVRIVRSQNGPFYDILKGGKFIGLIVQNDETTWAVSLQSQSAAATFNSYDAAVAHAKDTLRAAGAVARGSVEKPRYTFADPAAEKAYGRGKERVQRETVAEFLKTKGKEFGESFTRIHKGLPQTQAWARAHDWLREAKESPQVADRRVESQLESLVTGMDEREYDLLSRAVFVNSLRVDVEAGKDIPIFSDADAWKGETKRLQAELRRRENARVAGAIRRRRTFNQQIARSMVDAKLIPRESLKDADYITHRVLEYAKEQAAAGHLADIKAPKWKKRKGTKLDISTDFLGTEAFWMKRALVDIKIAETIDRLKKSDYNRRGDLIDTINRENRDGMDRLIMRDVGRVMDIPKGVDSFEGLNEFLKEMEDDDVRAIYREQLNGAPIYQAMNGYRIGLAIQFGRLDAALGDVPAKEIPPPLRNATDMLGADFDHDVPPWELLKWLADGHLNHINPMLARSSGAIFKTLTARRQFVRHTMGADYIGTSNLDTGMRKLARRGDETWTDMKTWQPDEGNLLFSAQSLTDRIMDAAHGKLDEAIADPKVAELLDPELRDEITAELRGLTLVGGPKYQLVVDAGLADTLKGFRDAHLTSQVNSVLRYATHLWKVAMTLSPWKHIKYAIRNVTGDVDHVNAAMGYRALKPADIKRAAHDLWSVTMRGGKAPADYELAEEKAVISGGYSLEVYLEHRAEIDEALRDLDPSVQKTALSKLNKAWGWLQRFNGVRENVMRLVVFRKMRERIAELQKDAKLPVTPENIDKLFADIGYGPAHREMLRGLDDWDSVAAYYARETLGDYGNLTVAGRQLRAFLVPFWSWQEINAKFYRRTAANIAWAWQGGEKKAASAQAAKMMATGSMLAGKKAAAFLFARAFEFFIFQQAWNHLLFPEEEEELTDTDQRRGHLILGKFGDEIVMLPAPGALTDVARWMGFEDALAAIEHVQTGRGDWGDVVEAVGSGFINTAVQGLNPFVKMPVEQAMGQELWPDVLSPRRMRDRGRHLARGMGIDLPLDVLGAVTNRGRPTQGAFHLLANTLVDKRPADYAAYSQIRSVAYEFKGHMTGEKTFLGPMQPAEEAFYNYRLALRFEDEAAQGRWRARMNELKIPLKRRREMLERAKPLGMLTGPQRRQFMQTLTPAERRTLARAEEYWRETFAGR